MRRLQFVLLTALVGACAPPPSEFATSAIADTTERAGTPVRDGWQPNEVLVPPKYYEVPIEASGAYRHGTSPEGYAYRVNSDGSGEINIDPEGYRTGWDITCRNDVMTDQKICSAKHSELGLLFALAGSTPQWLCLIGHDFPGRNGLLRLDKGSPISTADKGCIPWAKASRIVGAKEAAIRIWTWPYDRPIDNTVDVSSVKSAVSLTAFMHANIDRLSFSSR